MSHPKKVELLAPAGDFEKLEIAVHYGADAVYLSGKDFSLRNFSGNFTVDEIRDAVHFAHSKGVKVYVACNIFPKTKKSGPYPIFSKFQAVSIQMPLLSQIPASSDWPAV